MVTVMKKRSGVASWKRQEAEMVELRGQTGVSAHRRAQLSKSLFENDDFRAERCFSDGKAVLRVLNELVEDLCCTYADLSAMIQEFPDVSAWADGKLATLKAETYQRIQSRKVKDEDEPVTTRRRVTLHEHEIVVGEKLDVEARLRYVDQQYRDATAEIQRLKLENAELRGQILQLEKAAKAVV